MTYTIRNRNLLLEGVFQILSVPHPDSTQFLPVNFALTKRMKEGNFIPQTVPVISIMYRYVFTAAMALLKHSLFWESGF